MPETDEETVADMVTPAAGEELVPGPPPSNAERAAAAKAEADKVIADAKATEEDASEEEAENTDPAEGAEEEAEADAKPEALDNSVWGDTGDDVGNSVLETLQNSGVSTEEAKALLWDAVAAGDPTKVDRDALVEKVGKANATLIMAGIETVTAKNNAAIAEVTAIAHETAGSKEGWEKTTAWARKNMSEDDLAELKAMIDKGGRAAKFATAELVSAYNADPKNTSLNAGKGQVTPDAKSTKKVEGISRLEYGQQMLQLQRRGASQDEFAALRAKRNAGKAQGL